MLCCVSLQFGVSCFIHFLHDRPWILRWIKSISKELDIIIHAIASQLSGHCDAMGNRLWRHQQNQNRAKETRGRCVKIAVFSSFMESLCHVRNKIILWWRTVSPLTQVLFWCWFPSLHRNLGNKHKTNPIVSAETVRHSSLYTLFFISSKVT